MSICSSCGHLETSSNPLSCKVCGKEGCHNCMTYLFSYFQYGIEPQFLENWYCHTKQCYEIFAKKMEENLTNEIFEEQKFGVGLLKTVFYEALSNSDNQLWSNKNMPKLLTMDDFLFTYGNLDLVSRLETFGANKLNKKSNLFSK